MPHRTQNTGFQAFILCGPGASLTTFTHDPAEFPKALIPIANRPMLWYPLDWCYRMGVTDVTLITPAESEHAISQAIKIEPHLTGLSTHKPDILAPRGLTQTTGTAEIFRLPDVIEAIKGDFILLPCDIVCELDGGLFLEQWMAQPARVADWKKGGPLGVWYSTRERVPVEDTKKDPNKKEEKKKPPKQETDFMITTQLAPRPVTRPPPGSIRHDLYNLLFTAPTDTLKDMFEEDGVLSNRHALSEQHPHHRAITRYRDAHIYFFPAWVKEYLARNDTFENISEDAVGWLAKSGWQDSIGDKLGLRDLLGAKLSQDVDGSPSDETSAGGLVSKIDLTFLSTTWSMPAKDSQARAAPPTFASRVQHPGAPGISVPDLAPVPIQIPPVMAYVQPSREESALIRRVDTAHQLLNISLKLAKLPSVAEAGSDASPFAHTSKVASSVQIPRMCRVEEATTLIAQNAIVEEKCNIVQSVIGANCKIGTGARLQQCLLMDGVEVGENVQLTGCILGPRCRIEGGKSRNDATQLKDCQVQGGFVVEWGTNAKDEILIRSVEPMGGDLLNDDEPGGDDDTFG